MNSSIQQHSQNLHRLGAEKLVTIGDLLAFKDELIRTLIGIFSTHWATTPKKWLKSNEVIKLLGISKGTLQTLRTRRRIPYTKIGGIFYYDMDDINNLLLSSKNSRSHELP